MLQSQRRKRQKPFGVALKSNATRLFFDDGHTCRLSALSAEEYVQINTDTVDTVLTHMMPYMYDII